MMMTIQIRATTAILLRRRRKSASPQRVRLGPADRLACGHDAAFRGHDGRYIGPGGGAVRQRRTHLRVETVVIGSLLHRYSPDVP